MSTAEEQFNWFARVIEQGYEGRKDSEAYKILSKAVHDSPLYLFSPEKVLAAQAWVKAERNLNWGLVTTALPVIVADPDGCVLLMDGATKGGVHTLAGVAVAFNDTMMRTPVCNLMIGQIDIRETDQGGYFASSHPGMLSSMLVVDERKNLTKVPDHYQQMSALREALIRDFATQVITSYEQLSYTFKPRVVVVKEEAREKRKHKDLSKLPRVHQKESHIILDPDEVAVIKKAAGEPVGTHASPTPHIRRAHKWTLRAERYKAARGRTIEVGEIEVNVHPGETIQVARRIYHVVSVGGKRK